MNYRVLINNSTTAAEASSPGWDKFQAGLIRTLRDFPQASDAVLKLIRSFQEDYAP